MSIHLVLITRGYKGCAVVKSIRYPDFIQYTIKAVRRIRAVKIDDAAACKCNIRAFCFQVTIQPKG